MLALGLAPSFEVHDGEALGLLQGLQWVHEMNLANVIFELDAKVIVDSVHSNSNDFLEYAGSIIKECKHILALNPTYIGVVFVRRQANVVADSLVKTIAFWP